MKDRLKDLMVLSMLATITLFLLKPEILETVADNILECIMVFLRALDNLAVDYQLMRGNFFDESNKHGEATTENK